MQKPAPKKTDKICALCGERDSIFGFEHYLHNFEDCYTWVDVCHMCTIKMVHEALNKKYN